MPQQPNPPKVVREAKEIVLGIDPGYDRVGWAIGAHNQQRKVVISAFGCIQTSKKDTVFARYKTIQKKLSEILEKYQPTVLAIESVFFSKNKTTAIRVSEAKGVIIASCLPSISKIIEYTPPEIKLAVTGNGAASKTAITKMVQLQTGIQVGREIDDTVDAIAIVITHLAHHTFS